MLNLELIEKVHLDDLDLYVITFIALATMSGNSDHQY